MANQQSLEKSKDEDRPLEYCLRKYLLLLAIMVATVTYAAGFNPPGGVWQDTDAGHLAGDSIIRDTYYPRYLVFFYCNTAAFALSIVVIILVFILAIVHEKKKLWIPMLPLRVAMVLDLLVLVGAYAAGTSRAVLKARNAWVLVVILVYMVAQLVLTSFFAKPKEQRTAGDDKEEEAKGEPQPANGKEVINNQQSQPGDKKEEVKERRRKLLLLLATFVMSITYLAGLSAPGGYWDSSKEDHNAGDLVMREHHSIRLKAFFSFNATAFVMSLLIIMLLLDKQLVIPLLHNKDQSRTSPVRTFVLKVYIFIALVGLAGAYATGSTRESDTTIYVVCLVFAVLACIIVLRAIIFIPRQSDSNDRSNNVEAQTNTSKDGAQMNTSSGGAQTNTSPGDAETSTNNGGAQMNTINGGALPNTSNDGAETNTSNAGAQPNTSNGEAQTNTSNKDFLEKAQSLVVLLSTLVATITYQAGLVPPASLVIIILVQYKPMLERRILQFAMILDLFSLIGAYSAGSCRDHLKTSIYIFGLVALVLFIMILVLIYFYWREKGIMSNNKEDLEKGKSPATLNEDVIKQDAKTLKPTETKSDVEMEGDDITAKSTELKEDDSTAKPSSVEDEGEAKQNRSNNSIQKAKQETAMESPEKEDKSKKKHATRKYLMLLGVLAASVTYQAGLNPPGGVWQGNSNGHAAGNPVMHDNRRYRYLIFFYSNSFSFVASIVVIILLLPEKLLKENWSLKVMNITIVFDLLGLLLAYMAGSRMRLESSGYFIVFVIAALGFAAIHKIWSLIREYLRRRKRNDQQ
ncbi:hypothetical protein E2562_027702 [Oryza meyeriana var. granulata]|uniref:PGG domain-containing protein n=1 Tax=Oryza meyeriana var. granulata TaxID=110450 RepID=A0A6G1CTI6_9ORYZ|nr:hypothetical protein E2562_027702 [Oryza meyeriana var. granulata]